MLSFLLLLVIFFILWPMLKTGWRIWRQMSQVRRFMADPEGEMRRQAGRRAANSGYGTGRQAAPKPRKKKIPRDVGEYISYTEVELSAEERAKDSTGRQASFKAEEQVTDIKWVDIN